MAIIPGKLCGTVTGFALSTLAIISSPGKIRNEGTQKNCISAEMSENGRESNTLYENEKRNKIGDLSCFSGVLSYDTRQEGQVPGYQHIRKAHCMFGWDWGPKLPDLGIWRSIYYRRDSERTRQLLTDCKNSNYNCIRVWGGGHYPDTYFYDLCDELGLVV